MKLVGPLFIVFLVLILSSCAGPKSSSSAKFNLSFLNSDYDAGGLMVFGNNKTTNQYFGKNITAGVSEFELGNGQWDFIAIAWASASNPMEGSTKCAKVEGQNLSGEEVTVNLVMSEDECERNSVFGKKVSFESNFQIAPLTILNCSNLDAGSDPDLSDITKKCVLGGAKSMKVKILEFEESGTISAANALTSRCLDFSSSPQLATAIKLPLFNDPVSPLQIAYESYTGAGCTGTKEVLNSKAHFKTRLKYTAVNQINYIFAQINYCQDERNTQSVLLNFLSVSGQYIICSKAQFIEAFTSPNNSNSYILGKNLDFESEEMTQHTLSIATGGALFGLGHTITNFTLTSTGAIDNQALFSTVDGEIRALNINGVIADYDFTSVTNSAAAILIGSTTANANLEKISISNSSLDLDVSVDMNSIGFLCGNCQAQSTIEDIIIIGATINLTSISSPTLTGVGMVAGYFSGNLINGLLSNSSITSDSGFSTLSKIGGAIGFNSSNSYITDIHATNVSLTLNSNSQSVGGLIGFGSELNTFKRIYVDGSISIPVSTTQPDIGGVVGKITSGGSPIISSISSKVTINGDAMPTGGIVGTDLSTGSIYTFVYADTNITAKGTCGGIVGNAQGVTSISYARTKGIINCPDSSVGGIIASTVSTALNSVHSKSDLSNSSTAGSGGLVGQSSLGVAITDAIFSGEVSFFDTINNGTLIGKVTGASSFTRTLSLFDNSTNNDSIVGSSSSGQISSTDCYELNKGSAPLVATCTQQVLQMSLLNNFYLTSPSENLWNTSSNLIAQLQSDLVQELFPDEIGAKIKPFSITGTARWNAIAKIIDIDPTSLFTYGHFKLENNIDFGNDPALFHQWDTLKGSFRGNDKTISGITFDSSFDGSGIFGNIYEGTIIEDGKKKLYLNNIHFTSTDSVGPMGILAAQVSITAGEVTISDIEVSNSSVLNDSPNAGTGVIGDLTMDGTSDILISKLKITNSSFKSTGTDYAGAVVGNFNSSLSSPTNYQIQDIFVDSTSLVEALSNNFVGGIIGSAQNLKSFGLISEAQVKGLENVGGAIGRLNGNSQVVSSMSGQNIVSAGSAVGGIVGNCTTGSVVTSYTTSTQNSGATNIAPGGCGIISSYSVSSGQIYNSGSTLSASTILELKSDPTIFRSNLNDSTFAFYYGFGDIPRLRIEDSIKE